MKQAMVKKMIALLAASAMTAALFAGAATAEASSDNGTTFVEGSPVEQSSLDPSKNGDFGSYQVLNQVCDSILSVDKDGNLQDGLASYEKKDDLTYVFTFQEGVLFSDGTELTAEDAVFSIQHTMDPATSSSFAATFAHVDSVEATGTYEMTIKLTEPDNGFVLRLAGYSGLVFSKAAYEATPEGTFGTPEGSAGCVIGTGPYKIDEWNKGVETVLSLNENYQGDKPDIEKIEVMYFDDKSALLMALKAGQVDGTISPDSTMYTDIEALDNVDLLMASGPVNQLIAFNCEYGPFSDVNVRKAVACMVDSDSYMSSQYGEGNYDPAINMMVPLSTCSYGADEIEASLSETASYGMDLAKAQEYMAASDYPDGFDCNVMNWGDAASKNICLVLQNMLQQIGINVEVVQQTSEDAVAASYGFTTDADGHRTYDMFVFNWSSDVNEPIQFYEELLDSASLGVGGCNIACYSSEELDGYITANKTASTDEEKTEALIAANKIFMEDVPYVVVGYPKMAFALNTRFTYDAFSASWISNLDFKDIKFAK